MANNRLTILEHQHDELAGRVACLEEELRRLRKVLMQPEALKALGVIHVSQLEPVAPEVTASKERARQGNARLDALDAARKDALLERLARAERYAELTGASIAEAWKEFPQEN